MTKEIIFLLLITFIVVMIILLVKKNAPGTPPTKTTLGDTGCWTGIKDDSCPYNIKVGMNNYVNKTQCSQDGNGNWTCPEKILNDPAPNGAPGKVRDYLHCVCNGNGVCDGSVCVCNKDGNQGAVISCAPLAPTKSYYCTDPDTNTCSLQEDPNKNLGCANNSIGGWSNEEDCVKACYNPAPNGACIGDSGMCDTIPDGILNKGQFCGCPWNQDTCGGNCPDSGPTGCWWNGGGLATAIKCRTGKVDGKQDFLWRGMQCD
jgi:hypothetical protein